MAKGTHLPDINFAAPVFINGELIAFSCNVEHHADVGGSAAGSMASNVDEIYQEGLRLPVVKLFDRGRMIDDILRIILLNVRHPVERRGDYNAQIASCRLGARRLVELATAHGAARLNAVFDTVIARSERRLRDAIGRLADGEYCFEDYIGGGGARSWKDGKDGVQCHIPNTANTPVEVLEVEFPVFVEEYCLAPDAGGAGKYRGGLALRRTMRALNASSSFNGAGERFHHQPWGLFGGHAGAIGQFLLLDDDGTQTKLAPKPAPMICGPEQRIVVQSPGAGGYGNARERDPQLLASDWRSGKYSSDFMREHYGLSEAELEALPFDDSAFDYAED